MRFTSLLLAALLAAPALHAAEVDTMQSPECLAALDRLHAQEERQREAGPIDDATRAHWQALREAAARRCLGGDGTLVSPSQHTLRAPVAVAPVGTPAAPRIAIAPPPAALAPPRPPEPPLTLVSCDPAGCTASDGTRYTRAGSVLVGPRGTCATAGATLQCP